LAKPLFNFDQIIAAFGCQNPESLGRIFLPLFGISDPERRCLGFVILHGWSPSHSQLADYKSALYVVRDAFRNIPNSKGSLKFKEESSKENELQFRWSFMLIFGSPKH
jgi:hypothetical protein